jgi:hypothetical protein
MMLSPNWRWVTARDHVVLALDLDAARHPLFVVSEMLLLRRASGGRALMLDTVVKARGGWTASWLDFQVLDFIVASTDGGAMAAHRTCRGQKEHRT